MEQKLKWGFGLFYSSGSLTNLRARLTMPLVGDREPRVAMGGYQGRRQIHGKGSADAVGLLHGTPQNFQSPTPGRRKAEIEACAGDGDGS